jgi:ureidoglycolate hydrolase
VTAVHPLDVRALTDEAFAPFGAVLRSVPDGAAPAPGEAELDLSAGRPRFYVMGLERRPLVFSGLTRHRRVSQVLAAVGGGAWWLAVAPPGDVADPGERPRLADVRAFEIPGDVAVLLRTGTWHAGPFFAPATMSFFNLELDDTNVVDHQTHSFADSDGLRLELVVR